MNKYIQIIKTGYSEIIVYRFDVVWGALLTFVKILLAHIMWSALFLGKATISGFSYDMMITYYILVTFLARLDKSEEVSNKLTREIRNGSFAQYLVKPVHIMGYYFSRVFSKMSYTLWITFLVGLLWVVMFHNSFQLPSSGMHLLLSAITMLLGLIFLAMFNYTLAMLSFKLINISSFFLMKSNLIEFFTGTLLPLSLLPAAISGMLKYVPFYYVYYYPIMLYMGAPLQGVGLACLILGLWIVGLGSINVFISKRLQRYYDGAGI